ncbi:MAG TPA: tRNA lysidine(34) synthetase TilS [Patescibacteria group bacterium]|nr:tRNA lysidine(34) synthetase TilS [Patescibacteria group bacterium]
MILETFRRAVEEDGLLAPGERVLAAVSGGSDSVALLRLLLSYAERVPLSIIVVHVNHRLRAQAADDDQAFVEDLAARLGLECVVLAPRDEEEMSTVRRGEEGARLVRHGLLARCARDHGCTRIALGHTLDDQAETVMMRLVRGAGRRGLSGMARSGPGRLIRPMLDIRREEARRYLAEISQEFRDDETNEQPRFLRNRIRSRLIPLLVELNPSIARTLGRNAGIMAEEDAYLDMLAQEWVAGWGVPESTGSTIRVPAGELAGLPPVLARRAARLLLKRAGAEPRGCSQQVIRSVLQLANTGDGDSSLIISGGILARRDRLDIVVSGGQAPAGPGPEAACNVTLELPGSVSLPGTTARLTARLMPRTGLAEIPKDATRVALDAGRLGARVAVRTRLPGDTFHPLGAAGHRKLKEFMIDCKVPRIQRDRVPLLVGPSGIAWVVGYRIGHPYRLTDATLTVALIECAGGWI